MVLRTKNDSLLRELVPYLVATPYNLPYLDRAPFGLAVPDANVINPLAMASEQFLLLLQQLDSLTFGPEGMPMPRWVFYDCSELPGALFGFARPASQLSTWVREAYQVPSGYDGLVPYSMYIAIPMFPPGAWFGHNLCSIAGILPEEELTGLGSITKAVALRAFRTRDLYGATQWDSKALFIHTKFGPLQMMTAYTPAHSEAETTTYHFPVTEECLRAAAGDPDVVIERPEADFYVTHSEVEVMVELQDAIERGERFVIPGPPVADPGGGPFRVPVHRVREES